MVGRPFPLLGWLEKAVKGNAILTRLYCHLPNKNLSLLPPLEEASKKAKRRKAKQTELLLYFT